MHSLYSDRFYLRELTSSDASERYLSWFNDQSVAQYIAQKSESLQQLRNYINEKALAEDCMFFGIFANDEHIGNIKYEPIDTQSKSATMGIMIGEVSWRGKGVAAEVILATAQYLSRQFAINTINLGVEADNLAAIRAYKKIGFTITKQTPLGVYMALSIS